MNERGRGASMKYSRGSVVQRGYMGGVMGKNKGVYDKGRV